MTRSARVSCLVLALGLLQIQDGRCAAPPVPEPGPLTGKQQRQIEALLRQRTRVWLAGRFEEALNATRQIAALREQWQGKRHWQALDARLEVEDLQRLARVPTRDRAAMVRAARLVSEAGQLEAIGRSREAEKKARQALAINRRALGEEHPDTASGYGLLALCLDSQGRPADALPLYRQALEIHRKVLGEEHPFTARFVSPHSPLALGLARLGQPCNVFRHAEADLARGLLDDLARDDPANARRLEALSRRLRALDERLVSLFGQGKLSAKQQRLRQELEQQCRGVTGELSRLAAAVSARQLLPLADIQATLPSDAALVLWLAAAQPRQCWGCVVRRQGPPAWVSALSDPTSSPAQRGRLVEEGAAACRGAGRGAEVAGRAETRGGPGPGQSVGGRRAARHGGRGAAGGQGQGGEVAGRRQAVRPSLLLGRLDARRRPGLTGLTGAAAVTQAHLADRVLPGTDGLFRHHRRVCSPARALSFGVSRKATRNSTSQAASIAAKPNHMAATRSRRYSTAMARTKPAFSTRAGSIARR